MATVACVTESDIIDSEEVTLLERVGRGADAWNEWRQANPSAKIDLSGVDLSDRNLADVNFEACDLSGADFFGADLTGANLEMTDLQGADLILASRVARQS